MKMLHYSAFTITAFTIFFALKLFFNQISYMLWVWFLCWRNYKRNGFFFNLFVSEVSFFLKIISQLHKNGYKVHHRELPMDPFKNTYFKPDGKTDVLELCYWLIPHNNSCNSLEEKVLSIRREILSSQTPF